MSLTYDYLASWKSGASSLYFADLELSDGQGNSRTLLCSVEPRQIGNVSLSGQYDASIATFDAIYHGYADFNSTRYTQSDLRLRLFAVHTGDQDIGKTILDVMTAFQLTGATVTLYHAWRHTNLSSNLLSRQIFAGRVYLVEEITADGVTIRAQAEVDTLVQATETVRLRLYPSASPQIDGAVIPLLGGLIGFESFMFTRDKADAGDVFADDNWKLFNINIGTKGYQIENDPDSPHAGEIGVAVSNGPISDDTRFEVFRLMLEHDDLRGTMSFPSESASSGPVDLASAQWDKDNGLVYVPVLSGTEYSSSVTAGNVLFRQSYWPLANDAEMRSQTVSDWTRWEEAFNFKNLDSYAEITNSNSSLGTNGHDLIVMPFGAAHTDHIAPANGGKQYVVALVWVSTSMSCELGVQWNTINTNSTTHASLAAGWHIVTHELSDGAATQTVRDSGWNAAGEGIWIYFHDNGDTGNMTGTARVGLFCMSCEGEIAPDVLVREIIGDASSGEPTNDGKVPTFYYSGYGPEETDSPFDALTLPGSTLQRVMIAASQANSDPLTDSDFDTSGDLWSFDTLDSDFPYYASIRETGERTLADVIAQFQQDYFCNVWRSLGNGKWKVRLRDSDPTSDGVVMYDHNLIGEPLLETDGDRVVNAIYYDFAVSSRDGKHTNSVWIDNSTIGSRSDQGTTDSARESQATTSQTLYGRREVRVMAQYVSHPIPAWKVVTRMHDVLHKARLRMRVDVDLDFARQVEENYVFTTNASLDSIMRCPLFAFESPGGTERDQSWSGLKWWVTRITEEPGRLFSVEAVNID